VTGLDLAWLGAAAFGTSALTAVAGLGGGVILLSIMLVYLPPLAAIPLHGAVQLVSNGSRTWIQREHVRWGILARMAPGLLPAGVIGLLVTSSIPEDAARVAIGLFVLLSVWAPGALFLGIKPEATHPTRRFLWLGAVVGFLNTTVGATGPMQGPFFRGLGLSRHGIVGTFAATQSLGHLVKIALFGAAGFAFREHAAAFAVLSGGVVAGTWLGSRLLDRIDERGFEALYKGALTLLALQLVLWRLLFGG
jgi:uncharacterized membrane protein YfcA